MLDRAIEENSGAVIHHTIATVQNYGRLRQVQL